MEQSNDIDRAEIVGYIWANDVAALARVIHEYDLSAASKEGYTLLMLGAMAGSIDAVEFMLKSGADPNLTTASEVNPRQSALRLAICNGHVEIVELLIKYHVDINAIDARGYTAIEFARFYLRLPNHHEALRRIIRILEAVELMDKELAS